MRRWRMQICGDGGVAAAWVMAAVVVVAAIV